MSARSASRAFAGGGAKTIIRQAYITTGDVTLVANASWVPLTGFEIQLPASVGDWVELSVAGLLQSSGSDFFDLAVLTGGGANTIARRSSTGAAGATASNEGDPSLYPNAASNTYRTSSGPFAFTVTSSDLDGTNVRFALLARGTGGGKVMASANYPFRWRAKNLRRVG